MGNIIRFKDFEKLSKPALQDLGAGHAKGLLDDGLIDATVATVQAKKAVEYLSSFLKGLDSATREQITQDPEGWKDVYGACMSLSSTGDRLGYETDKTYSDLQRKLKERKGLLDLAKKSEDDIYDSDGVLVEKIKVKTFSKEILKVIL